MRQLTRVGIALGLIGIAALPAVAQTDAVSPATAKLAASAVALPSAAEVKAIAEEGFIYGLPMVMDYAVMHDFVINRKSPAWKAPFNQLRNEARVFTSADTTVVTPNSDTPYSFVWADLRKEPLVVTVPKIDAKRYYSVQLVDGNTFNYGFIGTRTTGNGAGKFMVVGPKWKGETPPGIRKVFRATTDFSLVLFRTQLFNPADMPEVVKVQAGYKAQTLSAFLGKPAPVAAPEVNWPFIDNDLVKARFFEYLDFVMQFAPAAPEEAAIRAKLARLGIGTGKPFDLNALPPELKAAIAEGMRLASERVDEKVRNVGADVNGWRIAAAFGDRAFFGGDWLLRAAAARAGIYGLDAEEATYPMTRNTADGGVLDGSSHKYTLTFAKGDLPPVNAFWSVTMYDGKSQFLVANPIDRYLINSTMLNDFRWNADGSLTLYIQKNSPGNDKEANWLPAPDGPIYMVMRLYWPKDTPPSILPPGKGTWKTPAVVQAD